MYIRLVYGAYSQSKNKTKAKILAIQLPFELLEYTDNNYVDDLKY